MTSCSKNNYGTSQSAVYQYSFIDFLDSLCIIVCWVFFYSCNKSNFKKPSKHLKEHSQEHYWVGGFNQYLQYLWKPLSFCSFAVFLFAYYTFCCQLGPVFLRGYHSDHRQPLGACVCGCLWLPGKSLSAMLLTVATTKLLWLRKWFLQKSRGLPLV